MSAYIVEDKVINQIVSGLQDAIKFPKHNIFVPDNLDHVLLRVNDDQEAKELGLKLFELNVRGIKNRYPDMEYKNPAEEFRPSNPGYQYRHEFSKPMQFLMSIRCLLYQCCEGNIPETNKLYQQLEDYSKELALTLIFAMPEYSNCHWG